MRNRIFLNVLVLLLLVCSGSCMFAQEQNKPPIFTYQGSEVVQLKPVPYFDTTASVVQVKAQYAPTVTVESQTSGNSSFKDFLSAHWAALVWALMSLLEVVVRLTPTARDNSVLNFVKMILDSLVPNARTGGGEHT